MSAKMFAVPGYVVEKHIPEKFHFALKEMEPDIAAKYQDMTISEVAKLLGIKVFDVALPIDWVRGFEHQTGFNPVGHLVMSYDKNQFGVPVPITAEGKTAYKIFLHVNNIDMG